jgi:hypothetical protein
MHWRIPSALLAVAIAGVGTAVAVWRKAQAPHRERTLQRQPPTERPRPIPQAARHGAIPLQLPVDGHGPIFQRRYRADIANPTSSATALMRAIRLNLPDFSPDALAEFTKTDSRPEMEVGDEYEIKILGPWNGSVRVIEVRPTSFALVTLEGHPEAGQISFQLSPHPKLANALRFEIQSWARSRDALVQLTYQHLKLGQEAQKNTWVTFCERVGVASGGTLIGEIEVTTSALPFETEELAHD